MTKPMHIALEDLRLERIFCNLSRSGRFSHTRQGRSFAVGAFARTRGSNRKSATNERTGEPPDSAPLRVRLVMVGGKVQRRLSGVRFTHSATNVANGPMSASILAQSSVVR